MKKLEELLNIEPMDAEDEELVSEAESEAEEHFAEEDENPLEVLNALTVSEKIDMSLPTVHGLNDHNKEMDEMAKRAMDTFEELASLGNNVSDNHIARVYEVSAQFLKIAADAKDSKIDKKLKMIDLQMKKAKLDHALGNVEETETDNGVEFDRNDILKRLAENKKDSDK